MGFAGGGAAGTRSGVRNYACRRRAAAMGALCFAQ